MVKDKPKMLNTLTKTINLELNNLRENKLSFFFYLIVPPLIIWLFAHFASQVILFKDISVYDYFSYRVFVLAIFIVTIQLVILRIVGERSPYGTLDRDLLAIPRSSMYLGKMATNAIFVLIQSILIYLVGFVVLPPGLVYGNPALIILCLFIVGIFGITLGMAVSAISKTKEQAIQFVPLLILLFLMGSDFFFVEMFGLPTGVETLSQYSPLSISYKMIEKTASDTYGFTDMITGSFEENHLLKLLLWLFALLAIGLGKFSLEKRG